MSEGRQRVEVWSRPSDCFCSTSVREERTPQVRTERTESFGAAATN